MSVDTSSVVGKANGHLMCEECNTYWCLHVEQAVRSNEDAFIIWDQHPLPQMLEIPVVPTSNLWATAILTSPHESKSSIYRVGYSTNEATEGIFLGFIHPTEGRNVIRSMILDWFVGTQVPNIPNCNAPGHGYKQTVRWDKDMKQAGTKMIQQWSIWTTGKCLGCTFNAADNSDLIPDIGPKKTPWDASADF